MEKHDAIIAHLCTQLSAYLHTFDFFLGPKMWYFYEIICFHTPREHGARHDRTLAFYGKAVINRKEERRSRICPLRKLHGLIDNLEQCLYPKVRAELFWSSRMTCCASCCCWRGAKPRAEERKGAQAGWRKATRPGRRR